MLPSSKCPRSEIALGKDRASHRTRRQIRRIESPQRRKKGEVKERGIATPNVRRIEPYRAKTVTGGIVGKIWAVFGNGDKGAPGIGSALRFQAVEKIEEQRMRLDLFPDLLANTKRVRAKSSSSSMARTAAGQCCRGEKLARQGVCYSTRPWRQARSRTAVAVGGIDDCREAGHMLRAVMCQVEPGEICGEDAGSSLVAGSQRGSLAHSRRSESLAIN
jgi:hypothetical protein